MKTIFYGGTILTMEDPRYVQAVMVEDGMITAVGGRELENEDADCRVNLHGMTMMPGFIDAHSHFSQVAASFLQVSLEGASSVEEIRQRIGLYLKSARIKPRQWVTARDYDQNLMPLGKHPSLEELDSFAPENPLVIQHKSGHMGLFNSAGLSQLGLTDNTPSPAGGKIEKKDGRLTGYIEENAFFTCLKKMPPADPDMLEKAFEQAQQKYLSYGITTIQDGMFVEEMIPYYQLLISNRMLKADLVAYADPAVFQKYKEQFVPYIGTYAHHLRIGGIKIFLDGSPQGKTAWMRTPYVGSDGNCGYGTLSDSAVLQAFETAAKETVQLLAHCNGDAAAEQFLRCLEQAEEGFPVLKELRPVIIHGQLIGLDQLTAVKKLGAILSFFVAHVYYWGDTHIRNFSLERASEISPASSALAAGIPVTFHQDAPVIDPDMLETVWCAANRLTKNGVHLGEKEEVSVWDALRAVTVGAAFQYGEEAQKGSIQIGKKADFVVLDRDPLLVSKHFLRDIQVVQVYKDGVLVHQA